MAAIEAAEAFARDDGSAADMVARGSLLHAASAFAEQTIAGVASSAAVACTAMKCNAGLGFNGEGPEWGALVAARSGSTQARIAEAMATPGWPEMTKGQRLAVVRRIEAIQIELLRHFVPEIFEDVEDTALAV
jgi:hypothetical protein